MIDLGKDCELSVRQQLKVLDLNPSTFYYNAAGIDEDSEHLMRLLDEHYTHHPGEGKIKRGIWLTEKVGYVVGRKRVKSLMDTMGLSTVYPKPNTSAGNEEHKKYPYLLREIMIHKPDQVWCSDITYIRLLNSHVYLTVIMDWHSRYIIEWEISITLEADFCVLALQRALLKSRCEIFNTDQGSQYTSNNWIDTLVEANISVSMDGKGRYLDNIFIERLWRTIKQECVYLHSFSSVDEAREAIGKYILYYNESRVHQGLDYYTPAGVYYGKVTYSQEAGCFEESIDNA